MFLFCVLCFHSWFYKVHKESMKEPKSLNVDNCEDNKGENDRRCLNAKEVEEPVTCSIELTDGIKSVT